MIYFQPVLQKSLFAIFHTALKNNGYLFLGKSETAGEYSNVFKAVCSAEKIYIHKGEGKVDEFSPPSFNIPNIRAISPRAAGTVDREQGDSTMETAYIHFLESFLPASVVLNEASNVIHFFGNYTDYMAIAPGKAAFNFFSMVNTEYVGREFQLMEHDVGWSSPLSTAWGRTINHKKEDATWLLPIIWLHRSWGADAIRMPLYTANTPISLCLTIFYPIQRSPPLSAWE